MLGRDGMGQRVLVLVDQLQKPEQHARAADRWRVGPGRKSSLRRSHGRIHIAAVGQRHAARHRACGGIGHLLAAGAGAGGALALDVVANGRLGGCGHANLFKKSVRSGLQSRSRTPPRQDRHRELIVHHGEQ